MKLPSCKITFLFFIFLSHNLLNAHNINTEKKKSTERYITMLDACTKKTFSLINTIHKTLLYSKVTGIFTIYFLATFAQINENKTKFYCTSCSKFRSECKCHERLMATCFDTIKKMFTEYRPVYNIKAIDQHLIQSREQRIIYYKKIRAINIIKQSSIKNYKI